MNKTRLRLAAVVCLAAALVVAAVVPTADAARKSSRAIRSNTRKKAYQVSARAALLIDGEKLTRFYDKDAGRRVYPASTTKVMTAIIVLERLKLDEYVTVGKDAVDVLPSRIDVKEGERYRVRDLLYAILLNSANDASVVLAVAAAGSEGNFVRLMNKRAAQLGAKNTLFANPHGLPSKGNSQYTTAYDMSLIFRAALKKPFFREAIEQKTASISSEAGRKMALKSHNKSLFKNWQRDVFGKTGFTNAAGACFVGYISRDDKPLIIAVFDSESRWDDIKFIIKKYGGTVL